jgi:hypothetical protein
MSFEAHVQGGVVVFDQPVSLPDGTVVRVEPVEPRQRKSLAERYKNVIGAAVDCPRTWRRTTTTICTGRRSNDRGLCRHVLLYRSAQSALQSEVP